MPLIRIPHWRYEVSDQRWKAMQKGFGGLKPCKKIHLLSPFQVVEILELEEIDVPQALKLDLWLFWFHGLVYESFDEPPEYSLMNGNPLPKHAVWWKGEFVEIWIHPRRVFQLAGRIWGKRIRDEIEGE